MFVAICASHPDGTRVTYSFESELDIAAMAERARSRGFLELPREYNISSVGNGRHYHGPVVDEATVVAWHAVMSISYGERHHWSTA